MMATDKRSLRGSLWEKRAGDTGRKVPARREEPFIVGKNSMKPHFCTCFSSLVFEKHPLSQWRIQLQKKAGRPLALTNAHLCTAEALMHPARGDIVGDDHATRGAWNDPSVAVVGVHKMTTASQTDESAQSLWKERERDVHIHPSILVSSRRATRLSSQTWRLRHSPTHTCLYPLSETLMHALCNIYTQMFPLFHLASWEEGS